MSIRRPIGDADLETLQRHTFDYFVHEANPANGLIKDKTRPDWPASIAATGLALAAYPVGVERGFWTHSAAVERTLATLRFFWNSPQGPQPHATGYHGFYYHFLDMQTGRRAWDCEVSTVDSAFLLAGALTAGAYENDRELCLAAGMDDFVTKPMAAETLFAAVLRWLDAPDVELVGVGKAAVWCQFPAALSRQKVVLNADVSDFTGTDQDYIDGFFVPGIQRAGGLRAARLLSGN